jgi:rhodanese-related sulfurtransferase
MDEAEVSIFPLDLYARLGTASAPLLIDVRRGDDFATADRLIVAAVHRPAEMIQVWSREIPTTPNVVVYCDRGGEVSQSAAGVLRTAGVNAAYLAGGLADWRNRSFPTRRKLTVSGKWITRERPKIDRIACPWLVRRFIDPNAEFLYVPPDQVLAVAKESGATPYDIKGVDFGHEGERCSFDAILRIFDIQDASLDGLAKIVRGADTSRHDLTPQCSGLLAISLGLSANFPDDQEMLRHGMVIYDALHTWCRAQQPEGVRQ